MSSTLNEHIPDVAAFAGLEWLEHPILALSPDDKVVYTNPAVEQMLEVGARYIFERPLAHFFGEGVEELLQAARQTRRQQAACREYDMKLTLLHAAKEVHLNIQTIPLDARLVHRADVLLELTPIDPQWRAIQEEQIARQKDANREQMRNLAHEIKNPLGGIRGAAQLLEHELTDPSLQEYTQVIRAEADRLQALLDRLLTPNPRPQMVVLNIHEVLERVRQLVSAETQRNVSFLCDYDASLPDLHGDRGQLIQVVLNIVRNAVQALGGSGEIVFRTRIARQVTLYRKRHALAVQVSIIDNGPGIPESLQPSVFYPLVTGRADGTGLGLSLAQSIVHQHGGSLDFVSRPGYTEFIMLLPISVGH
ncbi:PAS domain-containing sensor histidine kinase [Leeia sp. TBRC 13508]|uniref:histidine kinase n=1 Tax=Leeia speluncae TaxID=2884804 RepID=A0ABS8D7D6_9NEIS|nr:nitrogen regulation protein NR(II) [Leeia speluncae]MCB6184110.1 PAS domain-containing sensor histidine kinase [Leeia speluncae]